MPDGIAYQNKDILFKILSESYRNKSFEVLGLNLPKIRDVLPTNLPKVTANELRADNIFLLEDDRILIVDYESAVKQENFIKYLEYVLAVLKKYFNAEKKVYNVVVAVIYTGNIMEAPNQFTLDSLRFNIMQVFLSTFDTDVLYAGLKRKVEAGENLTDEDVMRFIILPLTEPVVDRKQDLIEKTIDLAKEITDEQQQVFIIAGILVATDKFIDKEYSNLIREWISMTKVARIFEEEKMDAVNKARRDEKIVFARKMLFQGEDYLKIMDYTGLTKEEILRIKSDLSLPATN